jgi:hypothetical protein
MHVSAFFKLTCLMVIVQMMIYQYTSETIIKGTGDHYVIMLHGLGGSPREFENLSAFFGKDEFTLIIPSMSGTMWNGLNKITEQVAHDIVKHLNTKSMHYTQTYKLSIIGNSMGGLIAKKVLEKINETNEDIHYYFEHEHLIMVVTPHLGIGGDYGILNMIRLFFSYFMFDTGSDLRDVNILNNTETEEFKKIAKRFKSRSNYVLHNLDLNVPAWSSRFRVDTENLIKMERFKKHRFCSEEDEFYCGKSKSNFDQILDIPIVHNDLNWDTYVVPMHSLLNHGNVIGKHHNTWWITWYKEEVENSMKHIRSLFD